MYAASTAYKTAIKQPARCIRAKLTVGSTVHTDDAKLTTISIETGNTEKVIGNAYCTKVTAELQDAKAADIPALGVEMRAVFWPNELDPDTDSAPTASTVLESVDYDSDAAVCTLTGYDKMVRLEEHNASEIEITYPTTIGAYAAAAAALAGLELTNTDWLNADTALPAAPNLAGSETCRDVIAWAAECAFGNAYIDRDGKVDIRSIIPSETKYPIDPDLYFESEIGSVYGPINTLVLARLPQNDNIYRSSASEDAQKIALTVADNPFLDEIRDDVIDTMFAQIDGVSVQSYSLDWCGDPAFDPGDTITLTDTAGVTRTALYGGETLDFDGGMRSTVEFKSPTNETVEYSKAASAKETLRRTALQVDKANGHIESIAEQTYTKEQTDIQISSAVEQESDKIRSEVSETYVTGNQLNEVKSTIEQQSDQLEFRFANINGELQNVSDALAENQELLEEYIRFKGALMELGKLGNDFTAELSNEKLAFKQNGVEIAYISNNKLYITDAEVSEHLAMGKSDRGYYDLYVRSNGHLTLKRRR